jgi:hypothetical protein
MPRSSAQSDFVIRAEDEVFDQPVHLPSGANPVALPKAVWVTNLASARATNFVMWFVFVTLALLLVLTVVGPHIPSGE